MADARPITVLVVDDHPLFRDGVAALLGQQDDMAVVGEASNGVEAITGSLYQILRRPTESLCLGR